MNWYFVNSEALTESDTGFTLYLDKGSWITPEEITPVPPPTLNGRESARLVRIGLEYARQFNLVQLESA